MTKKFFYFKFFLTIFLSFLLASFLTENIFIANSPKIRPNFHRYLSQKFIPKNFFSKTKEKNILPPNEKNNLIFSQIDKSQLTLINKGIYAASLNKGNYILIEQDEVEWVVYTFNIKGKEVKIKVPKGENPPPKEVVEKFYQ